MTPSIRSTTVRAGLRRGVTEFGHTLRAPSELVYYVIGALVLVLVLVFNRDVLVDGTDVALTLFFFPGILAMQVVLAGTYGVATVLATEREDGTLLRAKSVPNGMAGYVVGLTTKTLLDVLFSLAIVIVPSLLLIAGLLGVGWRALTALGILALGTIALVPVGFVIGSVFRNPRAVGGLGLIAVGGLIAVSGIFIPMVAMPVWAQVVAQIFPVYWLGLLLRGALLPDDLRVLELGESWRTLEALGVVGAWAILGLVLAPVLLRRMARRESGSAVESRRQAAMQRV